MCKSLLRKKTILSLMVIVMILGMSGPVFAGVFHFWTGAVSSDPTDANNWNNGTATPTLPKEGDNGMVGVNSSWARILVTTHQPVLTSEWANVNGDPNAGWWIIFGWGGQNSLTIGDNAYIKFTHNDCNLRDGAILRVTGRRHDGSPSIVISPRFRIGNQGDDLDNFADATSTLLIEDNGYLRFDPSVAVKGSGGDQIYMGGEIKALIDIRDNGILELANGTHLSNTDIVTPRFVFGSSDPAVNRVVISGKGQLILAGDPVTGLVDGNETSLDDMISMGLIASGEDGVDLVTSGTDPTVVKLRGQRISDPQPADSRPDADRDVTLSWDPGSLTNQYDVYFGSDLASVTDATRDNPQGVLKSQDQIQSTYPADGTLSLEYGQTYYWRVDEIDVPPNQSLLKGKVWSFKVEPFAIPIPMQYITVTASSQSQDQGPEKTVDRSGLDVNNLHSNVITDMWLSDAEEPNTAWIQYTFDKPYKLHQMLVWNYNGQDFLSGLGLKDVTIEYSSDGVDQNQLGDFELQRAPGSADYASNTTIPFNAMPVKSVKILIHNNWGDNPLFNKYGLSEVKFLHVPVAARELNLASEANEVPADTTLSWRAGREAVKHKVYLSTDEQAVVDGTAPVVTVDQADYTPSLELGTTYYWRVDEINDVATPSVWPGRVWSFTTIGKIMVDDFESYRDDSPNQPFQTWIDGLGFTTPEPGNPGNNTGAVVGYDIWSTNSQHIMEENIVYDGWQSLPVYYDNSGSNGHLNYSQIDRTFASAQDWTSFGITTLVVHFYGSPDNTGQLYVKINNTKIPYPGPSTDLTTEAWTTWDIDLAASGADLANVSTLSIGIDGSNASGLVYIDDLWLK